MTNPIIYHHENGKIASESYYLNGNLHREDGPAYIHYHKNGNISSENYFLNDVLYAKNSSETFQQDLKKYHVMVKLKSFW